MDDELPYLLLTPGPLTTSPGVRQAMLRDCCTWDDDYKRLTNEIRERLVRLATPSDAFTCVLMQGSGTFVVESVLGSTVPRNGKLLIINNGAYGARMALIATRIGLAHDELRFGETEPAAPDRVARQLDADPAITHVALVHCETTTGMLNPAAEVGAEVSRRGRHLIVDAMSSFGGVPLSMESLHADYLVSSANKCIQGTPGFGFVVARRSHLERTAGWARSLSLDLFDQWREMEQGGGKWRFTSPTHVVRAFQKALDELDAEGGVMRRFERYRENQRRLVAGMTALGFRPLLPATLHSPIITAFCYPASDGFDFGRFYAGLKRRRFVIYPGKLSLTETFRIGTIGHVFPDDIDRLLEAVAETATELGLPLAASPPPGGAIRTTP